MTEIMIDGPTVKEVVEFNNMVAGFTTNPTLIRNLGVENYKAYCLNVLEQTDKPVSIEVLDDSHSEILRQAREISSWGPNAVVKVPVITHDGRSTLKEIEMLSNEGIRVNVTAIFLQSQAIHADEVLRDGYLSIFAGRIADTGIDPTRIIADLPVENPIIWASPRAIYDYYLASSIGCPFITITPTLVKKLVLKGKDLLEYSIETSNMFYQDALESGFKV
ncbi:MAG: transaldolase family protein [bacterium]